MRLILDRYLEGRFISGYVTDGVEKEKYRCGECEEETFWIIYDPRHPVAGCTNSGCRVEARMYLVDALTFFWDDEDWGELPEEKSRRKNALNQKLGEISSLHLEREEAERREELEAERQALRQAEENAEKLKQTAGQWKSRSEQQEARAKEAESARSQIEEEFRRGVDRDNLYRSISRATVAYAATTLFLGFFLARAGTGMLFGWSVFVTTLYLLMMSGPVWYIAYAVIHQDGRIARERNEVPRPLHERLDLRAGLSWGWKIPVCLVVPYLLVDPVARGIGRVEWLASFLDTGGIEWLLLCTCAGLMCLLGLGSWMSEDLRK